VEHLDLEAGQAFSIPTKTVIGASVKALERFLVFGLTLATLGAARAEQPDDIPWGGKQLVFGTGAYGKLPIIPAVEAEPKRRGIELVALPTRQAYQLLCSVKRGESFAILHVTC
jgi:hypothetical protein